MNIQPHMSKYSTTFFFKHMPTTFPKNILEKKKSEAETALALLVIYCSDLFSHNNNEGSLMFPLQYINHFENLDNILIS